MASNVTARNDYAKSSNEGGAGMKRKPPDHTPEPAETHEPDHDGNHADEPPHGNTTTGTPRPTASATDAHEPEPKPAKHADGDDEGDKAAGHADETNATRPQPAPDASKAATIAADRRANEARPSPKADARNTRASGAATRTSRSAPEAQPTATPRSERITDATTARTSGA